MNPKEIVIEEPTYPSNKGSFGKKSDKNLEWEGPRWKETSVFRLKDEIHKIKLAMSNMMDQNKVLLEIIKSGKETKASPSISNKTTYMKNVPKSMP